MKSSDDLPQNHQEESKEQLSEANHLQQRLQASLDFVSNTCVFGSSNKMEDIDRTSGWVLKQKYYYYSLEGSYEKYRNNATFEKNLAANLLYDRERKRLVEDVRKPRSLDKYSRKIKEPGWYYVLEDYAKVDQLEKHVLVAKTDHDPLNDPAFHLDKDKKDMLRLIIRSVESKYGNCQAKAALVTDYLWRQPSGINRIEGFSMQSFDHVFVVVNRPAESDPKDSTTWGNDCWVIDPWYNAFYSAKDFPEKIKEIKAFGDAQDKAMEVMGYEVGATLEMDAAVIKEILWDINNSLDKYPSYDTKMAISDYYTFHNNEYEAEDQAEHAQLMKESLKGIRDRFFKQPTEPDAKNENELDADNKQDMNTTRNLKG